MLSFVEDLATKDTKNVKRKYKALSTGLTAGEFIKTGSVLIRVILSD